MMDYKSKIILLKEDVCELYDGVVGYLDTSSSQEFILIVDYLDEILTKGNVCENLTLVYVELECLKHNCKLPEDVKKEFVSYIDALNKAIESMLED